MRRAFSSIRKFSKLFSKIKQIIYLVIAKVRSTCGDPLDVHLGWPRYTGLPRRNKVSPRNDGFKGCRVETKIAPLQQ